MRSIIYKKSHLKNNNKKKYISNKKENCNYEHPIIFNTFFGYRETHKKLFSLPNEGKTKQMIKVSTRWCLGIFTNHKAYGRIIGYMISPLSLHKASGRIIYEFMLKFEWMNARKSTASCSNLSLLVVFLRLLELFKSIDRLYK